MCSGKSLNQFLLLEVEFCLSKLLVNEQVLNYKQSFFFSELKKRRIHLEEHAVDTIFLFSWATWMNLILGFV